MSIKRNSFAIAPEIFDQARAVALRERDQSIRQAFSAIAAWFTGKRAKGVNCVRFQNTGLWRGV